MVKKWSAKIEHFDETPKDRERIVKNPVLALFKSRLSEVKAKDDPVPDISLSLCLSLSRISPILFNEY